MYSRNTDASKRLFSKFISLACPLPPGQMSAFFSGAFPAPLSLALIFTLLKRSHLVKLKLTYSKRPPLPWKSILPISCTISEEVKETETAQGTGKVWVPLLTHL